MQLSDISTECSLLVQEPLNLMVQESPSEMVKMYESGEIEASGLSLEVILASGPWNLLISTKLSIFSGDTLNFLWMSSIIVLNGDGILDAGSDFRPMFLKEWPNVTTFRLPLLVKSLKFSKYEQTVLLSSAGRKSSTMLVVHMVGFSNSGGNF